MIKNVLHIDDDEDIRAIVKLALEAIGGLQVVQCGSGSEALLLAESACPDVFLLDFMMPNMNGEETLQAIKNISHWKDIPVIFITAKAHHRATQDLLELGAAGVIVKPFDPLTLADDIRAICLSNQSLNI